MIRIITTTLCILLFTLCTTKSKAQNNFRWADSGSVWHYNNRTPIFTFGYKHAWLEKDTIINGIECQQIKSEKQHCYQSGPTTYVSSSISADSTYYVYKNGINVFVLRNGIFKLWYKTQAAVNDIWHFANSPEGIKIDSIHSFNYNNQTLHDYYLSQCDSLGNTIVTLVYEPTIYGPDTVELRQTGIVNDLFGPYYGFEGLVNFPPNPEFGDVPNFLKCFQSNNFPQWISYGNDCYNGVLTNVQTIDFGNNSLALYPNPTNDILNISYTLTTKLKTNIQIINSQGQIVKEITKHEMTGEQTIKIDIKALAKGLYYIRYSTENNNYLKKLIVN